MGRCGLSSKELSRVEVMGRVKAGSLRLQEAAELLWLSYRQAKRVWAHSRRTGSIQTLPPALPGIPTASKMSRRGKNEHNGNHPESDVAASRPPHRGIHNYTGRTPFP